MNIHTIIYHIKEIPFETKMLFQKIFRKHHTSNVELWNLNDHLAKIILPKLVAFREAKINSYPMAFSDWSENNGWTEEEYHNLRMSGEIVGGGVEGWKKALDEMIYAFEYSRYSECGNNKKEDYFYKKYGYIDPHKDPSAERVNYEYLTEDGMICWSDEPDLVEKKGYKFIKKDSYIYNSETAKTMAERAAKGYELFGRYFQSLWD